LIIVKIELARELLHRKQMGRSIGSLFKDEQASQAGATPFLSRAPRDGALPMIFIALRGY
jgi:hypothetical protein